MNESHIKSFKAAYDYWFENKPLEEVLKENLNERQVPPAKGDKEPEDKQPPKVEVKKVGTDQSKKEKMNRNMAETMIGDLLFDKYSNKIEEHKEKVVQLAAHILTLDGNSIRQLLKKFNVSSKDVEQIVKWVEQTK